MNINAVAAVRSTVLAGTYGGGIFHSNDAGEHWNSMNTGLSSIHVYSLLISGNTALAGTSGRGVWKYKKE